MQDMDSMVVEARDQFEDLLTYVVQAAQDETALHEVERSLFRSLLGLGRTLLLHFLEKKGWETRSKSAVGRWSAAVARGGGLARVSLDFW
jgi:hypothetical protein